MKALFIGRFQPFHNGHLQLLQNIADDYDHLIIGIGSSQYKHTIENPFTLDERRSMIEQSLKAADIKNYTIIPIPDIHNLPKWVSHVESLVADFDIVISNNTLTKRLFSKKGYRIIETPWFNRYQYSGKEIRRRMINDEPWKNLVPNQVYIIIMKTKGVKRLKQLSKI